jgi:hypothetical protein
MKLSLRLLMLSVAFFTATTYCLGQPAETLTNAKIVNMVKAGLPKTAIIASIQGKPSTFDTSTDALIALKKHGVPDDIITAIASKQSPGDAPNSILAIKTVNTKPQFPAFVPVKPANLKDCKMVTGMTESGQSFSMVEAASKLGKFRMTRDKGKITLIYDTKQFFAAVFDEHNRTSLKIDSVQFVFADNSVVKVKAIGGYGKLPNKNTALKPQLEIVHLAFVLEPGSLAEHSFTQTKLKAFLAHSEKDGQYGDQLNDGQQDKFLAAFNCIP